MKLLEKLTTTPGIPGREHRMRELIRTQIKGLFDSIEEDAMGNLICVRKPTVAKPKKNPTRVMLASHMDQIGFMVKHIDDKGFVRIVPVGGFDPRNLYARIVTICPDPRNPKKDITGVMNPAGKPIHVTTAAEKNKNPEIGDFSIDLGLPAAQVKKKVKIGDMVVMQAPFKEVGNTVVSQCLDNRVACWLAIRSIQQIHKAKTKHACEIHCVFTCQEEVGLRGALTSAYSVKPDIGIGIDTTLCIDTPGVPEDLRTTEQGGGAALTCMDSSVINDYDLIEEFEAVAKKKKIKYQRSILARGGTDSGALQRAGGGCRTLTFSCPTRYIHTVTEMTHKDDLFACRDLLAAWLQQVK
jgi:tetrahedral aminopeptidase